MRTLDEALRDELERDPSFAHELELAEAELQLAEQTAAIRESRGLTQAALGQLTGMAQSAIARYERAGRTPTVETLWKLATALDSVFMIGPRFSLRVIPLDVRPSTVITRPSATAEEIGFAPEDLARAVPRVMHTQVFGLSAGAEDPALAGAVARVGTTSAA